MVSTVPQGAASREAISRMPASHLRTPVGYGRCALRMQQLGGHWSVRTGTS